MEWNGKERKIIKDKQISILMKFYGIYCKLYHVMKLKLHNNKQ